MDKESFPQKIVDFIKSKPLRSLAIGLGIFFVPILIIHFLFKIDAPWILRAEWSAGEILGYTGSIIGAIATIIAIIITIQLTTDEQKSAYRIQKEERRLAIKPHIQSSHKSLMFQSEIDEFRDGKTIYVTYPVNSIDAIPGTSTRVPFLLENEEKRKNHHTLLYSIRNVGAGNAIDIEFIFNGHTFIPPFSLVTGSVLNFIFVFADSIISDPHKDTTFLFKYSDVASYARYQQVEHIRIFVDEHSNFHVSQEIKDLMSQSKKI